MMSDKPEIINLVKSHGSDEVRKSLSFRSGPSPEELPSTTTEPLVEAEKIPTGVKKNR